jgi:hypothetical protein
VEGTCEAGNQMELIIGELKRIGNGITRPKKKEAEFSFLEIGERVLNDVKIDQGLCSVLEDGLKTSSATKIWLNGKKIMALQVDGGTRYYARLPKGFYFSFALVFIVGTITGLAISSMNTVPSWIFALIVIFFPVVLFGSDWLKYSSAAKEGGSSI